MLNINEKLKQEIIESNIINSNTIASRLHEHIQYIEDNILPTSDFDEYHVNIVKLLDLYSKLLYFTKDDIDKLLEKIEELKEAYQLLENIQLDIDNNLYLYNDPDIYTTTSTYGISFNKECAVTKPDEVRANEKHTPYFDIVNDNEIAMAKCDIENIEITEKCNQEVSQKKIEPSIKMNIEADKKNLDSYNFVNHPVHYNNYDIEVIEMMRRIWGDETVKNWCILTAWKYRQRMGSKPGEDVQRDIDKEQWYLQKAEELKDKSHIENGL